MRFYTRFLTCTGLVLVLAVPNTGHAFGSQENAAADTATAAESGTGSQKSHDQMAREMSNPLAAFYRFDYQAEYRTYQGSMPGAGDQTQLAHIFQPVIPFRQKNGKGWVFRFALPFIDDQPIYWANRGTVYEKGYAEWLIRQVDPTIDQDGEFDPTHGHTDAVSFDLAYGGVRDSGLILMYGLAGELPTTSDTSNGKQQLILGPELNIGKMTDWGVYGALISHVIDVAEKSDKGTPDTTITTIQAYFSYGLGNGWQLVSNPTMSYDWEGDSGNKLNLPLGGGIAKTTRIGKMPFRMAAELQKFVASTDRFGPDWMFKLTLSPVIPNKYTRN